MASILLYPTIAGAVGALSSLMSTALVPEPSMEMAVLILLCSASMWLLGIVLTAIPLTHWIGSLILDRCRVLKNWTSHTVRSFLEVGVWLWIIDAAYRESGEFPYAVAFGSVGGTLVVALSQVLRQAVSFRLFSIRFGRSAHGGKLVGAASSSDSSSDSDDDDDEDAVRVGSAGRKSSSSSPSSSLDNPIQSVASLLDIALMFYLLGMAGPQLMRVVVMHYNHGGLVCMAMTISGGVALTLIGEMLSRWTRTRQLGLVFQRRMTNSFENWRTQPFRSLIELSVWLGTMYYVYARTLNVAAAVQYSTFVGVVGVMLSHATHFGGRDADLHSGNGGPIVAGGLFDDIVAVSKRRTQQLQQQRGKVTTPRRRRVVVASESDSEDSDTAVSSGRYSLRSTPSRRSARAQTKAAGTKSAAGAASPRSTPRSPRAGKPEKTYTMAQVAHHDKLTDGWIVLHDGVYDVTKWCPRHPGGAQTIVRFLGRDATDEILVFHPKWVETSLLPAFRIGRVSDAKPVTPLVRDFREFHDRAAEHGLMERDLGWYCGKLLMYQMMLAAVVGIVYACHSGHVANDHIVPAVLGASVLLGVYWQQMAFIGHDTGHMTVFVDRLQDWSFGLIVGNFLTGISIGWWKATHNTHHAVPNTVKHDPDIMHLPVFAITPRFFAGVYHTYHQRLMSFDAAARRVFIPLQHYLYYPIMSVARFNLYVQGIILLITDSAKGKALFPVREAIALVGFYLWNSALVSMIPGNLRVLSLLLPWCGGMSLRLAFVLVSHALAGVLHVQITLSHFSAPVNDDADYGGDFFTRNVASSVDVDCYPCNDWVHGGLQFQTIHHCFPRVCRRNLRQLKEPFRLLCAKHGLTYVDVSFYEANRRVFETLRQTAEELKTWSPHIGESLNLVG